MAKPKPNDAEAVSLFPFLSILACLIGVLTFIITAVAISQMDQSEDIAAVERTEKYGPIVAQLEIDQQELERLDAGRNAEQRLNQQISQVTAKIQSAQKKIAQQQDREKVRQEAQSLQEQLAQVDREIDKVKPNLTQLREKIKQDQTELQKRVKAGRPAGTVIRSAGSGVNLKPHFIECNKDHLILYLNDKQVRVDSGKLRQSKEFLGLFDRVAKQEKERVVFLLRPEGTGLYYAAVKIARERQCRNGKIPVPGEGPVDLSFFGISLD